MCDDYCELLCDYVCDWMVDVMAKTCTGVIGFLEIQKNRLVDFLIGANELPVGLEEEYQMIGAGYNAACALNLMGLLPDNELQTIGMMITRQMRR